MKVTLNIYRMTFRWDDHYLYLIIVFLTSINYINKFFIFLSGRIPVFVLIIYNSVTNIIGTGISDTNTSSILIV
ncbi:hypothetical protein [Candidatus Phytoplasma sacchari]